jgi:phospholipid transport system substrate-binding protein
MVVAPSEPSWMRQCITLKLFVLAVCTCFLVSLAQAGSSPLETVQTGTEKVLHTLKEHAADSQKRREEIRKIVDNYFDFDEMAKRSLGPQWNKQAPAKQQEFVQAFSKFLFNVYIDKIEKYTDEKITYKEKEIQGDFALVDALVVGNQSGQIPLTYHLHLKDGNWKAYDVVIEGVGLVENYRSQFDSILSKGSFEDLLKQLREKNLQRT